VQSHLILDPNADLAEKQLLETSGLRKFRDGLKTEKEKEDFRRHLRRYMQIYLPDCPFEVSSTNRYTIVTQEAAVTARRPIRKGQPIKYLSGIQVMMTAKEEEEISERKKDFSIVVSSRSKCASLFMGPARFANHDCDANAQLTITSQSSIEIFAKRNIEFGDEITVTYGDNYFGENNCECLCQTCESKLVNGWAQDDGAGGVKRSIEEATGDEQGYSLRSRRRSDSLARLSRTPSMTPEIRPRVAKSRTKISTVDADSNGGSLGASPAANVLLSQKRKREFGVMQSPPITPSTKRLKVLDGNAGSAHHTLCSFARSLERGASSTASGSASDSDVTDIASTNVTTPDESKDLGMFSQSQKEAEAEPADSMLKVEDTDLADLHNVQPAPLSCLVPNSVREAIEQTAVPATGIPAVTTASLTHDDSIPGVADMIVIPPPLTPATKTSTVDQLPLTPAEDSSAIGSVTQLRGRGRPGPRKNGAADSTPSRRQESVSDAAPASDVRKRVPGDYALTHLLLSEPTTAWVRCTICSDLFVQRDAYYTRSACPRCERHSKLYGYQWPKTESDGKHDKEERVLDHRLIHRFLDRHDEAKVRGRKGSSQVPVKAATPPTMGRGGKQAHSETKAELGARRSGRRRNPSLKASEC
jgi:[histone H4]-N-methyl-L-lysine20 N-methyltransferase